MFATKTSNEPHFVTIRKNTPVARANFLKELSEVNFNEHLDLSLTSNPSDNYMKFHQILSTLYEKYFPIVRVKFKKHKHKKNPWITFGIIKSITKRDKLYSKLKKMSQDDKRYEILTDQLKNFNKILRRSIILAKRSYYTFCFSNFQQDIKKTWQTINSLLSRGKKSNSPDKIIIDGTEISDKNIMAEKFNSYFADIGPKLASEIPSSTKHFSPTVSFT